MNRIPRVPPLRTLPGRVPRAFSVAAAFALASCVAALACSGGDPGDSDVTLTDSAGVTILTHPGDDTRLVADRSEEIVLGGKETDTESFYSVSRYTVATAAGRIHVLDRDNHRILVFDGLGRHLRTLGRQGDGPGELQWPASMAVAPDGTVSVFDIGKRGLVTWDPDGEPTTGREVPTGFFGGGLAFTDTEMLVAVDGFGGSSGPRLLRMRGDGDTATIVALPPAETKPIELESCGMAFSGMPRLFHPLLRWAAGGGLVAVAAGSGYVVDLYRDGTRVRSVRRGVPQRTATRELAVREVGEGMRVGTAGGERVCRAEEVVEQRGYEDVVPAVGALALAPDGSLWVERWRVGEEPPVVDLFGPDGIYRGTLPEGMALPVAFLEDGRVIWSERNELDVERMVIGTIEVRAEEG